MNSVQETGAGILVVDDHASVRAGLKNLISSRSGWVVCGEAEDGQQAVALALRLKPAVIVMDISMPVMNGLEASRRIRQQIPNIEIVVVSQHDSEQVVLEAQRAGARGFVLKSHLSADLLPALESALLHSSRVSSPVARAWQEAMLTVAESGNGNLKDPGPHDDLDLLAGGGEMGALMRSYDWSKSPLGPVSQWPQSLRTAVRICLDSRFPILIWWGPELRLLYNDAWRPTLGTSKDPLEALCAPGKQVWSEIWDTIGPSLERVLRTGQATWESDQLLVIDRHGYLEESYWTYCYSAIRLASGEIGGVFSAVHEVTDRVLSARRNKALREVSEQVIQAKNDVDACTLAMQSIQRNPADFPYAMIFLCENQKATRVATSFDAGTRIPWILDLSQEDSWWIKIAMDTQTSQVFHVKQPETMPAAPYGDKCQQAISIPILGATREAIAVMTVGISPYRALDEPYREFLESLARNLAANINNARAYDQERKRAEALAELDRAKTAFFSNISHEFRTPLTLMLGPLEDTLSERAKLSSQQREQLEVAHRNSLRLLKLVNTLLDFSRIEAGRVQASFEPTDLANLTAELASMFSGATERAGLRLVIQCPRLSEAVYVDRDMWEKIVFNLLSNAFKFTFSGEIEVSLRRQGAAVALAVRDSGTGIPAQELPHLFERFYRVKGAHGRTFEGSGIGLALVQELAKLHGGAVHVESEVGRGSTFIVTIPLGKDHLPAERIGQGRTLASTGLRGEAYVQEALRWLPGSETADADDPAPLICDADLPSPSIRTGEPMARILVADDNADMREYLYRLLGEQYEVVLVNDGEAALKSAVEQPPDLILSDVMMPRLDGSALVEAVRADAELRNVPIILLSARAGEESRIEGLQSGADDYLVKPFSARELIARVNTHLTMAQIRQQTRQRLAEEAEALIKLNEWSSHLWQSRNLEEGFDDILAAVIELLGADKGNVLHCDHQGVRLTVHRGFEHDAVDFLHKISLDEASACRRALSSGERVVIEDVETDSLYAALCPAARAAGVRAVVSTPLRGPDGDMLGIVSAHFRSAHRPTDQDLRRLDLYLRQAADFIRRCRTEENYRKLAETLDVEVRARTKELDERNVEVLNQSEQVRELSRRLLTMQDEERRHIARELHDSAGQNLAVLSIHLSLLVEDIQKLAPDMSKQAIEIQNLVHKIDQEIRTNSYLLHPPLLDEAGLPAALQWYVDGLCTRSDLNVTLDIPDHFERPPQEIELVMFRIVQECLTNIHRHSGATHASVRIAREPESVIVEVQDDGKGISPEKLAEIQLRGSGVGLRGMRERVRQFHGELKIESHGCGTKIHVNIPLPKIKLSGSRSTVGPIQQAVQSSS